MIGRGRVREGGLTVVLYHELADSPSEFVDRLGVSTRPEVFESHIEHFMRRFDVVGLDQVLDGHMPPRPLLITFDDAYRSVLEVAGPVLARHGLPSVFFVAAGVAAGTDLPMDNLLCYLAHHVPLAELEAAVFGAPVGARDVADLIGRTADLAYASRSDVVARVSARFGLDPASLRAEADLFLAPGDLERLNAQGMEVGNHTASHVHCRALTDDAAVEAEVLAPKRMLEGWTGAPVRAFSYPYGNRADATPYVEGRLRESGHEAVFLVGARRNARAHRGPRWYRVSLENPPARRLTRELELMPVLRRMRDRLQGQD